MIVLLKKLKSTHIIVLYMYNMEVVTALVSDKKEVMAAMVMYQEEAMAVMVTYHW